MTQHTVIRIGLPYASRGRLLNEAVALGGRVLISTGSMQRAGRLCRMGDAPWFASSALDSAGFVAMVQGGYRWTVSEYVEWVVTNGGRSEMPFPWEWWSAMDYCCEEAIAPNRAEVARRIQLTTESYRETLCELDHWREEGVTDVPDPLPIVQGRTPADYIRSLRSLEAVLLEADRPGLPSLIGVGSVCTREIQGPEGLLPVVEALAGAVPPGARLHLFGVKGEALPLLARRVPGLVESVDSMAWDFRARREARAARQPSTVDHRAYWMRRWVETQQGRLSGIHVPGPGEQLSLLGPASCSGD